MDDLTVYGIRNCDTVKKARAWLEAQGVGYRFHDYKVAGVDGTLLDRWIASVGWEPLVNRAGPTFRKLPEGEKANLDRRRAVALMVAHPSLIKRPVLESRDAALLLVGFKPDAWARALGPPDTHPESRQ